jgi:hypothetical protein
MDEATTYTSAQIAMNGVVLWSAERTCHGTRAPNEGIVYVSGGLSFGPYRRLWGEPGEDNASIVRHIEDLIDIQKQEYRGEWIEPLPDEGLLSSQQSPGDFSGGSNNARWVSFAIRRWSPEAGVETVERIHLVVTIDGLIHPMSEADFEASRHTVSGAEYHWAAYEPVGQQLTIIPECTWS